VPGVFAPVELDGRLLVDGGLVNPIPIAPTLNDATDMTIAVNLAGIDEGNAPARPRKPVDSEPNSYRDRILKFLDGLRDASDSDTSDDETDATELLVKSIDVMQGAIARLKLAAYAPDMTIEVPRNACSFFEFNRAEEMADLGYELTRKAIQDLRKKRGE
jgi:NTE family protein